MTPTPDDVRRTKAWAACQDPPVTVYRSELANCYFSDNTPLFLSWQSGKTEDEVWQKLWSGKGGLAPVFASVRPVIEAEALERAAKVANEHYKAASELWNGTPRNYDQGQVDMAEDIERAIRSLIPPVTT